MRAAPIALLAVLALAAPAAAATPTPTPTVTPLTAPTPMPLEFAGTAELYGHKVPGGEPIPAGSTVLSIDFAIVAGQDAAFDVSCPAGSAAIDISPPEPSLAGGFDGPIGQHTASLRFEGATVSGLARVYLLCLPQATTTRTRRGGRRAPVRFGRGEVHGLRRGERLRRGQRLLAVHVTGLQAGQSALTTVHCGRRSGVVLTATSSRAVRSVYSGTSAIVLRPSNALRAGRAVTVYAICARGPRV